MNILVLKNRLRYGSFFIPFRFQFILLIAAMLFAWRWLQKNNALPDTSYTAILGLFVSIALWFIAALLLLSFLTALIPWLLFLFNKKNKRASIDIKTAALQNTVTKKQHVQIHIEPVISPLFGYIRLRLQYDDDDMSQKFSLINTLPVRRLFSSAVKGVYDWPLPEIKEYKVTDSIIYFEDMFQFFSFATTLPAKDNFYTQPADQDAEEMNVQPKKTENTTIRIDQIRRVEGEFLNYKNFEDNDDVRRIVWKIYAKNKELVVRVPETNNPYASHAYFYASFYNSLSGDINDNFNTVFLNHFKSLTWSAFYQLSKKDLLIKYISDQPVKEMFADDPLQKIKFIISTSNWQKENDLIGYFKKDEASVLCISSLTDAKQVEAILEHSSSDLTIIFVRLTKAFTSMKITDWVQWIFVRPAEDSLEKLRLAWNISPLRSRLVENEKNIESLLSKCDCEIILA